MSLPSSPPAAEPHTSAAAQRLPINPPFYYGWVVVAIVAIASFLSSGVTNVVISVLLVPMTEETGWSRTMISSALGVGAVASGVLSPFAGSLADRFGGRVLISVSGVITGVLYLIIASATAFPVFVVSHAANRAIAWSTMSGVAGQAAVASWFNARRPRALGIVGMVGALGGSAMAVLAQFLLNDIGWRGIMTIYGVLTLLLVVGPSAFFLRRRPEDLGLLPDGFTAERSAEAAAQREQRGRAGDDYPWTLRAAMRTPALWLVTASGSIALFGVTAVSVHQMAYFGERGVAAEAAASVLLVYTLSSAVSSFIWGLLTERFDERIMSVGALALAGACIWFLTTVTTLAGALAFALVFGACARGQNTLVSIVFAQYYGRNNFGAISGFSMPFQTFAAAVGPVAAAVAYDTTGSYEGVLLALVGVFALASFLMFLARRPAPPAAVR